MAGKSMLSHWPVQIKLIKPKEMNFVKGADVVFAADCAPVASGTFHQDFVKDKVVMIGCPKFDNINYLDNFVEIINEGDVKSVTSVRMEVPCCSGIQTAARKAVEMSGKNIPLKEVTLKKNGVEKIAV